jgi:hydroxyacylglutathione hydrolase
VLHDSQSNSACVIDPGGDLFRILAVVDGLKPSSVSVLLTHAHIDHAGGTAECLKRLRQKYGTVQLYAHSNPILRGSISQQARMFGLAGSEFQDAPDPDVILDDGDAFSVGSVTGQALWTPGHAPDHLSVYFNAQKITLHDEGGMQEHSAPCVVAGDALFAGSIGRTDLPGGDIRLLLTSISRKLLTLPDETIVLSGHGPNTTIGNEKRYNPFLQDSD